MLRIIDRPLSDPISGEISYKSGSQGRRDLGLTLTILLVCGLFASPALADTPRPPEDVQAVDHPWDSGEQIDVLFSLSPDDVLEDDPTAKPVIHYLVGRSEEQHGLYEPVGTVIPQRDDYENRRIKYTVERCESGQPYYFRVRAVGPDDLVSSPAETGSPVHATQQWFDGTRLWLLIIVSLICGSVLVFIQLGRWGVPLYIRKIAGLEAVDEAVGRATEMGRSILFVPGSQDMNDIQTVAGLTVLSRVSQTAAEYGASVEVPTSRSLVMTTARESVQAAYSSAGRPDAYNENSIYYVTNEQFGYVAYLSGMIVRDKPAACFYMGAFYAESLVLAETGHSVGAIQVAGTAEPSQLPFFVAACDYTLIGEEFFAASAYLAGDADQLGSLKGQDLGKFIAGSFLIIGCGLMTVWTITGSDWAHIAVTYLTETVLR